MNERSLKKQEKINNILDYGVQAFREKGYHNAGVQELATACGLSKGSFYQYFQTKENFCKQVIEHYCEGTKVFLQEIFGDNSVSGLDSLKAFYNTIIEKISSEDFHFGCLYGDLAAELGGVNNNCSEVLSEAMARTNVEFTKVIEKGQQDGSIRSDIGAETLTSIMTNSFSGIILKMKVDRTTDCGQQFINNFLDKMMQS